MPLKPEISIGPNRENTDNVLSKEERCLSEAKAKSGEIQKVNDETKLRLAITKTIIVDPYISDRNAELGVSFANLIFEAQKEGATEASFHAALKEIKESDSGRNTKQSLYFISHLSRWLPRKKFVVDGEEWQVINSDLGKLMIPKPGVITRKTNDSTVKTTRIFEVFRGLKL